MALAGCGGSTGPTPTLPPSGLLASCQSTTPTTLGVGQAAVTRLDQGTGCLRLAGSGTEDDYLFSTVSGVGTETSGGTSGEMTVTAGVTSSAPTASVAPVELPAPLLGGFSREATPASFHHLLREEERRIAVDPVLRAFGGPRPSAQVAPMQGPPAIGSTRNFQVCTSLLCPGYSTVQGQVRYVNARVVIYQEVGLPTSVGFDDADLKAVGDLFAEHLFPIDTLAFGRESDIDNNGVVAVLLTYRLNQFTPNCGTTGSVTLGYFFGNDLTPQRPNSNAGEIFYSLVPDPNNANCRISRNFALRNLPVTFVHEFQHMISYNQHVLQRGGPAEETWLNEGLSHYAEELAGRQVPGALCPASEPQPNDCFSQFTNIDIQNAYSYLQQPQSFFLITPGNSSGSLEERGANWLFVRWLADHYGSISGPAAAPLFLGTALTRALVATTRTGGANVAQVTGQPMSALLPYMHAATFLESVPNFTPADPRLLYRSWNFAEVFAALNARSPSAYPQPYPLQPDLASSTALYQRTGPLRGGSARHVRLRQPAGSGTFDVRSSTPAGTPLPATLEPRGILVRFR